VIVERELAHMAIKLHLVVLLLGTQVVDAIFLVVIRAKESDCQNKSDEDEIT